MIKKITLSLVLMLAIGAGAYAQKSKVKFGVKAGVTLPKWDVSGEDAVEEGDPKPNTSMFFTATADIAISPQFSLQPGLSISGKGMKYETSGADMSGGITYSYSGYLAMRTVNLDVPINIVGKIPAGSGNVFVGAGPYVGYALSGTTKYKVTATINGETETEKDSDVLEFGGEEEMKRIDFGLNFLGGYQLKNGFNINVGYGLGLSNLVNTSANGSVKNRVLSFGLGYSF